MGSILSLMKASYTFTSYGLTCSLGAWGRLGQGHEQVMKGATGKVYSIDHGPHHGGQLCEVLSIVGKQEVPEQEVPPLFCGSLAWHIGLIVACTFLHCRFKSHG